MEQKSDFQKLDQFVVGSHKNGHPVLRLGSQMQIYFRNGHDPAVRHKAVDVITDFARAASGNITLFQKDMANRMNGIGSRDLAAFFHAEVDRLDPKYDGYGPHVSDEFNPPRWQGAALLQEDLSQRKRPIDLSTLHLAVPATLAKQDPDDLIRRLSNWCQMMQPLHGTAGLAPIYEIGMQTSFPVETWPLLSRFTGLDYANTFVLSVSEVNQIRNINWLTILGGLLREIREGAEHPADWFCRFDTGNHRLTIAQAFLPKNGDLLSSHWPFCAA